MASYDAADSVAQKVAERLGTARGLVGVGVAPEGDDFVVTVRITPDADDPELPSVIDEVPIRVLRRDAPRAR